MEERHFRQTIQFDLEGRFLLPDGSPMPPRGTVSYRNGLKVRTYDVPSNILAQPNMMFGHSVEGHDVFYSAKGCTRSETIYDANDRPAEVRLLNARGGLLSRVVFKRDASGRLIEEDQRGNSGLPLYLRLMLILITRERSAWRSVRRYSYNERGQRAQKRAGMDPLSEDLETFKYNEYGDVVVHRSQMVNRTYTLTWRLGRKVVSEFRHESEVRFEYAYDALGNWVEKITRSNGSESPSSREVRTITYWD